MTKYYNYLHLNQMYIMSVKKLFLLITASTISLFLLVQLLTPVLASAEAVSVYVTSSATTVQKGATFQVSIWADTSGKILDVKARVNYSPSKFSFKTAKYENTPLTERGPEYATGSGYYTAHQLKQGEPYPSGRTLVGVLEFIALADSGSGSFTVSSNENDTSVGNGNDGSTHSPQSVMGVSVNFAAAPTASQPVNSGTNIAAGSNNGGSASPITGEIASSNEGTSAGNSIEDEGAIAAAEDEINADVASINNAAKNESARILDSDSEGSSSRNMNTPLLIALVFIAVTAGATLLWRSRSKVLTQAYPSSGLDTQAKAEDKSLSESLDKISVDTPEPGASIDPNKDV